MQHSVNIVLLGKTKPRKCFHAILVETFSSPVHQIAKEFAFAEKRKCKRERYCICLIEICLAQLCPTEIAYRDKNYVTLS